MDSEQVSKSPSGKASLAEQTDIQGLARVATLPALPPAGSHLPFDALRIPMCLQLPPQTTIALLQAAIYALPSA